VIYQAVFKKAIDLVDEGDSFSEFFRASKPWLSRWESKNKMSPYCVKCRKFIQAHEWVKGKLNVKHKIVHYHKICWESLFH